MIYAHSRYADAPVEFSRNSAGEPKRAIRPDPSRPVGTQFHYHVVVEGDRLDLLAARYYRDTELWWAIADANPEVFYPDDLDIGTTLRIPRAPALR